MIFANKYEDFQIYGVDPSKKNSSGEVYVMCPICPPYRRREHQHDKKLAVNVDKGVWYCQHCGHTGGLTPEKFAREKTTFDLKGLEQLSEKMIEYWKKRRISEQTLKACEIKAKTISVRQKSGEMVAKPCVAFIFRQNGWVRMLKYRDNAKNFRIEKGSKLIPWGLDFIKNRKECIITEGEPDRLSYHEIGFTNTVSVPAGTQISPKEKEHFEKTGQVLVESQLNLSYFDECIDHFSDKETIYIASDSDAAGIKLRNEIGRRFGYHRCRIIRFDIYTYQDDSGATVSCKDANDVLVHLGPDRLRETLETADTFPLNDVRTIDDEWDSIMHEYRYGTEKGVSTGYPSLDPHFTWKFGHLVVVNGYPNMGKTSFVVNLAVLASMKYKWKWGIYSPENYPVTDFYKLIMEIYLGNTLDKDFLDRATEDDMERARDWVRKYFEVVNNENGYTPGELRSIEQEMILRRGIVGFIKDPWNSLVHNNNENIKNYLEKELSAEQRFAINNNIINMICVHPPTPKGEDRKEPALPKIFEIDGGAIWAAKAYEIISVHIEKLATEVAEKNETITLIDVQKTKPHKLIGIPTRGEYRELKYLRRSNRYIERDGTNPFKNVEEGIQARLDYAEGF